MTHSIIVQKERFELFKQTAHFKELKITNVEEKLDLDTNNIFNRITIEIENSMDLFYFYQTAFQAGQNQ